MIYCTNCGKECADTAKFCSACGTKIARPEPVAPAVVEEPVVTYAEPKPASPEFEGDTQAQQGVLDKMYRFLKWRKKACSIFGVYFLVMAAVLLIFGLIFTIVGALSLVGNGGYDTGVFGLSSGIGYIIGGVLYVPIAIVNFAMKSKANRLMNEMYYNVRPAAAYSASIGQIVLCYFFNTISMIFAIIGCVHAKSNAAIIDQIERNQSICK